MSICNVLCSADLPEFVASCKKKTRQAGIKALLIMGCDVSIDLTDTVDVAAAILAGTLVVSPTGLGSKPLATSEKAKLESCSPETSKHVYTHVVNFKTAFIDATGNTDFDAFNDLILNSSSYRVVLIGCNDMLYMNPAWTALSTTEHVGLPYEIDGGNNIAEDGAKDVQMYELTLSTILTQPIIKGTVVAGIATALGL